MRLIILIAFAFSGMAALIYEVAWTRALTLILGSTTYALSTMLGTFMAGLAIGSWVGGKLADRWENRQALFGFIELGIGLLGLITIPLINALPPVYYKVYTLFRFAPTTYFFFQFLLCAGIMIIPTTLMGATFPVVSRAVTLDMKSMGRGVGNAYSFNTMGAIVGSFGAGFLLIPFMGVKATTIIAASLNIIAGITIIVLSRARVKPVVMVAIAALFVPAVLASAYSKADTWALSYYNASRYQSYEERNRPRTLLFDEEDREGRVRLWRTEQGSLSLEVGGKPEGTYFSHERPSVMLAAYLPIASHPDPKSLLNIGLGVGVTVETAKEHVKDISVVEINATVVDAIRELGEPGLLDGVDVKINDARNYLLLEERKFDIITSQPSFPTEPSVANLFTSEFYELASKRLSPGGVFCQWLPYWTLSNDDITMMLRTFGSTFKHVYLWRIDSTLDLMLVGSNEPFIFSADEIGKRVASLNINQYQIEFVLSRTPEQVRAIVNERTEIPLNTDDRPLLEFHAARNYLTGVRE
jgi:spermidine synthase